MNNGTNQEKDPFKNNLLTIKSLNSTIINLSNKNHLNHDTKETKKEQKQLYISNYNKYILDDNIDKFLSKIALTKLFPRKFSRRLKYFNKIISSQKEIDYKLKIKKIDNIFFKITKIGTHIIKNNINTKNHLLNEKFFKYLIVMVYQNIIPIENFIIVINIFLNNAINKIISENIIIDNQILLNNSPLFFINDLFEALINVPKKLINEDIHIQLINELINSLDRELFSSPMNFELHKLDIWFKLLGNKNIRYDIKKPSIYNRIITFLVKIYKFNYRNLYFYKYFYEPSAVSNDYYINSLDFLNALFKEEEKKRTNEEFKIKRGFYVYNNTPLTLNKIKIDINTYSLIFSFKLTKINNLIENIVLFNFTNTEQKNILKFVIIKEKRILKIINAKNQEWNTNVEIEKNKDYLICLSQDSNIFSKGLFLYIMNKRCDHYINKSFGFTSFKPNLTLELGKSNFEGIMGEVIIIDKLIKPENIDHLFNLRNEYADILPSINNEIEFTSKNKKYSNKNEDINFFKEIKYQCPLKVLTYYFSTLLNNSYFAAIKPHGLLQYSNNKNNKLKIRLYSLIYSVGNFAYQHGLEYLIFQFHKIISLSENDELLNYYLYKTLNFALEYIKSVASFLFPSKDQKKFKIEGKYIIFVLSFITVLYTKRRKLRLDDCIKDIFLQLGCIYREKNIYALQKMNFHILLDNTIFKKTAAINYIKIFDEMIAVINNEGRENVLFYKEIFCRFLLLDYILESKDISHKKYMAIINFFINGSLNEYKKDNKSDGKNKKIINIFCQYLMKIKSPIKIYHYLKIIYLNVDSNKQKDDLIKNENLLDFIIANSNKIVKGDSKYNQYIQILCFLLSETINKTEIFIYAPYGFMNKPNYAFIKAIFIQCFNISNNIKFKFIKSSLFYDNEMDVLKIISENKDILSLIKYEIFIPRLNSIIKYFYYLYINFLKDNNDRNLELILKQSINLILDFLYEISNLNIEERMKDKKMNKSDNIILIKKRENKDTQFNKPNKQEIEKKFIEDLYTSSGIKLLFILYYKIFEESQIKDRNCLDKQINFSINIIYNSFYFHLLLPEVELSNNAKTNFYYKSEILKNIINQIILINSNNMVKNLGNVNEILVKNSILVLIKTYHIFNNNILKLNSQLEKNIIIFLKYIFENNYFYSKYIFNINLIDETVTDINKSSNNTSADKKDKKIKINNEKDKINKMLPEITLDIIFKMLEKKEEPELIPLLYQNLKLKENSSIFYKIDEFFLESNNKNLSLYQSSIIKLLNSPNIITPYCNGTNINNILYTIYFFIYFLLKQKLFLEQKEEKEKTKQKELRNLINKAIEVIFKDCINIFKKYFKIIKKNKYNYALNEDLFRIYGTILDQFSSKYKDNNFIKYSQVQNIINYFLNFLPTKGNKGHKLSLFVYDRTTSNYVDLSINIKKNKVRKATYLQGENEEFKEMYEQDDNEKTIMDFGRQRSHSENYKQKPDEIKKQLELEKNSNKISNDTINEKYNFNKKDEENISNIHNKQITLRDSKSNYDNYELNNTKDISNINNNDSSDNDSDNFEDIINCDNMIEEEKKTSKKGNYSKNYSSSDLHFLLSPHLKTHKQENNSFEIDSKRKATRYVHFNREITLHNIDEEDILDNGYKMLINKVKRINIVNDYYQKIVIAYIPKWVRIIFNPKRALFKIFGFAFKNYIYNNRRFNKLKNAYNLKYRRVDLEMSIPQEKNYFLKYPTKLKNYVCSDYYKPFLKPMLNYFENEYFATAHSYIEKEIIDNDITEKDKFYKINYVRFIPDKDYKPERKRERVRCELITNKGSLFGIIIIDNELMIFRDLPYTEQRPKRVDKNKKPEKNAEVLKELFFLFSSDVSDRLDYTDKYIIIYYSEIKEIISRKFCFSDIAYEIFMKDGRAYYFNFFTGINRKAFHDKLINNLNATNSRLLEKDKLYYAYDHNYVNISFINDPNLDFQKNEFRSKYLKNELTSFQYLLLINKFSSRSYNDCGQYLVFPLLYMDVNKKNKRDLSKPICLNKEEIDDYKIEQYKNNYELTGCHFNTHYATMAYVLYYLMRMIPFTFDHIKLQSGHFDVPARIFSSLDSLLFIFSASDENRELVPEFFYSYESFLNLNYNNFGFTAGKQINHFNTNQNCGIIEFIIDLRKMLEKSDISGWINNIFGCNQYVDNCYLFNKFPNYSYEQHNNFNKEKEELYSIIGEDEMSKEKKKIIIDKIKDIKNRIQLLTMGITPSQLFKSSHPVKDYYLKIQNMSLSKLDTSCSSSKSKIGKLWKNKKSNIYWINKSLNQFLHGNDIEKLTIFTNKDNNRLKLLFLSDNSLQILSIISENEKDLPHKKIELDEELTILQIKPYKNVFVELYDKVYLLCRFINNTILLCTKYQKYYIEWDFTVTALEFYSHDLLETNNNISLHLNKILLGDKEGNLSLIEIRTEYNEKKKELKINNLNILEKRQKIFYSYINGILYNKRLNIIISSCNEGIITINNGFSFEILNIIELDNNPKILDYKLSEYDLLYIHTENNNNNNDGKEEKYNFYCYTMNGIKISTLELKKEYINYFIDTYGISAICKDGSVYGYNCANLKDIDTNLNKIDINDIKSSGEISYCIECPDLQCILVIFKKESKIIRKNSNI